MHGEQPGSAYNGHVRERIHYPLIAPCAETGDPLAGLLRDGNAGPAQQVATWIRRIVQVAREHLAPEVQVRLDAGFSDGATLAVDRGVELGVTLGLYADTMLAPNWYMGILLITPIVLAFVLRKIIPIVFYIGLSLWLVWWLVF